MAYTIKNPVGQDATREQMLLAISTSETGSTPVWSLLGRKVTSGDMEFDWQYETGQDILGNAYVKVGQPLLSQSFDACPIEASDAAIARINQLAVVERNPRALANMDVLVIYTYMTDESGNSFAERYPASGVFPSSLGGDGGGTLDMTIDVSFGGTREVGHASVAGGIITFTPDAE